MAIKAHYRKGAMKAAIDAELEAERGKDPGPVDASDVRDLAEKLLERSLRVLEKDLSDYDARVRSEAARTIGAIGVNLLKQEREPAPTITAEERAARLAAAESSPEVRAYLVSHGWKEPET